jgi:TolA-binding protein
MSEDDDTVRVGHIVPREIRDQAQDNSEHGELSEEVRSLYRKKAQRSTTPNRDEIDAELRQLRGEIDEAKLELRRFTEEKRATIEAKEKRVARLEERKDKTQSKSDQFEGAIEQLVARIENGEHVFPELNGVKSAAKIVGEPPEYVISEVRERCPDAPDELFEQGDVNGGGVLF